MYFLESEKPSNPSINNFHSLKQNDSLHEEMIINEGI